MNNSILHPENAIRISAEFLEDGYVLKSGRSRVHRYELDLELPGDLTCDQLLGAIYAGLRRILVERYRLDVRENLSGIAYNDHENFLGDPPSALQQEDDWNNVRVLRDLRIRAEADRYVRHRRKSAALKQYHVRTDTRTPEERERLGWLVCWQVFLECFHAYSVGYPKLDGRVDARTLQTGEYRYHPVIARSTVDAGHAHLPLLWLEQAHHGGLTLKQLGFVSGSRLVFDPVLWHQTAALLPENQLGVEPPRRNRQPIRFPTARPAVHIPPPQAMPPAPSAGVLPVVLPTVVTTGSVLGVLAATGTATPESALLLGASMAAAAGVSALANHRISRWAARKDQKAWMSVYERRIQDTLRELQHRQEQDIRDLTACFPPVWGGRDDLVHRVLALHPTVADRRPGDPDFLLVRLGVSAQGSRLVPALTPICRDFSLNAYPGLRFRGLESGATFQLELSDGSPSNAPGCGDLADLADAIADQYGYLSGAPVTVDLKATPALGFVAHRRMSHGPFLSNFLLDACYHHRPEELQIFMLCPECDDWKGRQEQLLRYKNLPHFWLPDRSAFAFDRKGAVELLNHISRLLQGSPPHILLVVREDYGLGAHPVLKAGIQGLTVLRCVRDKNDLPSGYDTCIQALGPKEWYLTTRGHGADAPEAFHPDPLPPEEAAEDFRQAYGLYDRAFPVLGALHTRRNGGSGLPAHVELFQMLTIGRRTLAQVVHRAPDRSDEEIQETLNRLLQTQIAKNWADQHPASLAAPLGRTASEEVLLDLREEADGGHAAIVGAHSSGKTSLAASYLLNLCARFSPELVRVCVVDMDGELCGILEGVPQVQTFSLAACDSRQTLLQQTERLLSMLQRHLTDRLHRLRRGERLAHQFVVMDDFDVLADLTAPGRDQPGVDLVHEVGELIRRSADSGFHLMLLSKVPQPLQLPVRIELGSLPGRARLPGQKGQSVSFQSTYAGNDIAAPLYAPFRLTRILPGGPAECFFDSTCYTPPAPQEEESLTTAYGVPQPQGAGRAARRYRPGTAPRTAPQKPRGDRRPAATDSHWQTLGQGDRRYPYEGIRETPVPDPEDFLPKRPLQKPRRIKLARPDAALVHRSPMGITQARFLAQVMAACHGA